MPNIPFPNVPSYPGVPIIPRQAVATILNPVIASIPALAIGLGTLEGILGDALQQPAQWGIFDSDGNQLGASGGSGNPILAALAAQVTGANAATLSTLSFDFSRETQVSDFPLEEGSFANFNKVHTPAEPFVTLALGGSETDRTNFLNAIEAACISTDLFSVITPEVQYVNYSIERYSYQRRADRGATLIVVEIALKEIRQVSAAFTQSQAQPITNPQNPGATTQVNNGMTQPATPPDSTLLNLVNKMTDLLAKATAAN